MKFYQISWVICSTLLLVNAASKPSAENIAHGNKDPDDDDVRINIQTTLAPSDLSVDLPENWDQAKDDSQSLFINKNDKNDLEPYPMALSDDVGDVYDGQPISANGEKLSNQPNKPEIMEHVIMRAELYGEPPSMGRQPSRRKRAEPSSIRSSLSAGNSRVNKRGTRYSALRIKRDIGMNDELRTLISLWDAEQRRLKEEKESYYNPASYYNQYEPYEDAVDESNYGDMWLNEPVIAPSHYSNYYEPLYGKSHYKYPLSYSNYKVEEPDYIQHLETLRRKRQWAGFNNRNHLSKRFMVAKKRSEPNQYYYSQKSFKPREDLYSLSELLKSTQNLKDQSIPISRRMIL